MGCKLCKKKNEIFETVVCRVCGQEPEIIESHSKVGLYPRHTLYCDYCGVGVFDANDICEAIENWNRMNVK